MSKNPLVKVDLGKLSKPATVLIKKIAGAVGTVFEPYQIVRLAKAEAKADLIREESKIELTELRKRTLSRWIDEEARKQSNMEAITGLALPLLGEKSAPEDVEDDWIAHFFEKGRLIKNEEMQRLWAAVLAGEANEPGSFSKRTVNLLADLDRYDAELFTRLCGFGWKVEGHELAQLKGQSSTEMKLHLVPMVFGRLGVHFSEKYTRYGINYAALAHLASLGLILFSEGGYWWHGIPQKTTVFYFGRPIELEFPKPNYPSGTEAREYGFAVGQALLTRAGHELAQVCRPEPVDGFYELTRKRWEGEGIIA